MREETGDAAIRSAAYPGHIVSQLTPAMPAGQAANAGGKLAIIRMPLVEARPLTAIARHFGWLSVLDKPAESALPGAKQWQTPEGQATFFVDQIPHSDAAIAALAGHRKVLLAQELRSLLVAGLRSEMRQRVDIPTAAAQPGHDRPGHGRSRMCHFLRLNGPALFGQFLSILTWMAERDVILLRSEDLAAPDESMRNRLAPLLHLDGKPGVDADAVTIRQVARDNGAPAAGDAAGLAGFWSNDAEQLFTAFGGCLWNRALGYDRVQARSRISNRPRSADRSAAGHATG